MSALNPNRLASRAPMTIRASLMPRTRLPPIPITHLTHNGAVPATWHDEWLRIPRASREEPPKPASLRKAVLALRWTDRWRSTAPSPSSAILLPNPTRGILSLHQNLTKGQSAIHTQIVSEKIGLRRFLTQAKVPDIPSAQCRWCGMGLETAKHVTISCTHFRQQREALRCPSGRIDFKWLTLTRQGVGVLTRWWLRLDIIDQFKWARQQRFG